MRPILCTLLFIFAAFSLSAQQSKLAQQYYNDGEYEKASVLYEQLYDQTPGNDYFFTRYVECLLNLENFERAEDVIQSEIKRRPRDVQLYVTLGSLYERQFKMEEAEEQYERAVRKMPADKIAVIKLAQAFTMQNKYDYSIATYEKGSELLNDSEAFSYNLGELYRRKGDSEKMIENYLNSLAANPNRAPTLQTMFQRYLAADDFDILMSKLYERIQQDRNAVQFVEMLTWVFIQQKDYRSALRQVRALDRRFNENGSRIYQLAQVAANDGDLNTAIDAFEYIIEQKGRANSYYIEAKRQSLRLHQQKLVSDFSFTREELKKLEQEYLTFLDEFGRSRATASIMAELAELQGFYLNDLDKAVANLQELIELPGVHIKIRAQAKLTLADFYLMQGERWEATLLYSQVDKQFEDDPLGHEARFRNAKLSYYFGDFEWAQAQFEVLKASTSKLIANDALDLSVFIMDNLGLDTTETSIGMYAESDLLIFQNRLEEAEAKLDSILQLFPEHSLKDDVLYAKAKIRLKKREYEEAAAQLQQIVENHGDEIRADNALFELAELNEFYLGQTEKAKELYEKLFIEYSNSTFAVEARKRYRKLRGDNI